MGYWTDGRTDNNGTLKTWSDADAYVDGG
ncbi:MAG: hypothetical protein RLZZ501_2264, partial [Pseudomonadota bacterium]